MCSGKTIGGSYQSNEGLENISLHLGEDWQVTGVPGRAGSKFLVYNVAECGQGESRQSTGMAAKAPNSSRSVQG